MFDPSRTFGTSASRMPGFESSRPRAYIGTTVPTSGRGG
jgi:hypothetical protein